MRSWALWPRTILSHHSWVRISQGLNKFVTDLSDNKEDDDNELETSEMQFEDFALKTQVLAFASQSMAKAKSRRRTSACSSTRTVPISERSWTDVEPENFSSIAFPVSNNWVLFFVMVIYLEKKMERSNSGKLRDYLRNDFVHSQHSSDEKWKSTVAKGGGNKKKFQHCTDPLGQEFLYLRALRGHSIRNSNDPELQDNELIPNNFFECIYHVGCAINLHSIINSGLMLGGQHSSKRQTVFFTPVDPMNKEHRDPNKLDLEAPRLAWYHQKQWKKHQNTVCWVDIKFA